MNTFEEREFAQLCVSASEGIITMAELRAHRERLGVGV